MGALSTATTLVGEDVPMRTGDALRGREPELERLVAALDGLPHRGGCFLVHGDAGIGKSALVDALADTARAQGRAVLTASGVRSEAHLPFAALHQLLDPLLSDAAGLPDAQRAALLGALGRQDAEVRDVMAVALAALALVRGRATEAGALVVVEDAQWFDRPSADVVGFVARRIEADPVLVVATDRRFPTAGLPDVRFEPLALGPLDDGAARELLAAQASTLDVRLRDQLVREAAGNPLALLELAAAWSVLPAGTIIEPLVPVTERLVETFAARVETLPPVGRALVLVAAVADGQGLADILAATAVLGYPDVTHDDLYPAVEARLVEVGPRGVRFRHPLVRSTTYEQAGEGARRAAHAALADVIGDHDRAAWHRAAALVEPDEAAAAALEGAGDRARRRGAPLVAARAYERAAALSPEPARQGRRLVRAAYHAHGLGRHDVVVRLLDEAEAVDLSPVDRARAAWRRQLLTGDEVADEARVRRLVEIVGRMRDAGDVEMAVDSLVALATQAYWRGLGRASRALLVEVAESLPLDEHDPRLLHVLGMVAPIERGPRVRAGLAAHRPSALDDPGEQTLLGVAAGPVGDQESSVAFLTASVRALRIASRYGDLTNALMALAWAQWHRGFWVEAAEAAEEAGRLGEQTERPGTVMAAQLLRAQLASVRGDTAGALALTDGLGDLLRAAGAGTLVAMVDFVRATALSADARDDEAYEVMRSLETIGRDDEAAGIHQGTAPVYIDAALATGRVTAASATLDALEALATAYDSSTLGATLSYARPLVAADADAELLFEAADRELRAWPFLRARALLAYGTWLRRQRRATDARAPLRTARDLCDRLGAEPWGDRARRELRAAGESSPRQRTARRAAPADGLTAQELEIARLAASGLTNREIGRRLHLSHRTVGSHLYHVFPKLGITTRAGLAAALAEVSIEPSASAEPPTAEAG